MDDVRLPNTCPPDSATRRTVGAALLSAAMALPLARPAHAENAPERGVVSLKYLDYQDSQPGDPRIRVRAPALMVMAPIAGEWSVGGTYTSDAISGASPAYHTSNLTKMHDHRRAGETEVTRYLPDGTITVGASASSESDYLSRGLSFQATHSSEDKNTTWNSGLGFNSDVVNPTNHIVANETKQVADLILGVTQVLTINDIIQLNLGFSSGRGYYSDPYKIFDNRPREHNHRTLMTRWNHYIEDTQGTARFSYRYYADNWSIKAHTFGFEYVQPLTQGWTVTPLVRLYSQIAANFYIAADSGPFAPSLPAGTIYVSEDQRISAFGAHTFGLKLAKQLDADWLVDLKIERYEERGSWTLFGNGSSGLATFYARSIQAGLSRQF